MTISPVQARIAATGLLAALAFVLSLPPRPPGVELHTFVVFASGQLAGVGTGVRVGILVALLRMMFGGGGNPLLALGLAIAWGAIGAAGGLFPRAARRPFVLGALGALLTLFYQLVVNLSLVPGSGLSLHYYLVSGIGYIGVHVANNACVFEAGRFLLESVESHPAYRQFRAGMRLDAAPLLAVR